MTRFLRAIHSPLLERAAAGSLRVWLMAGILLRITRLRDRWSFFELVYYTTPWPAIACGLAILALHAARKGRRHHVRRYVILTGGALFTWFALSWQTNAPSDALPTLRVAAWNVARPGPWRMERCADWLRPRDFDLIALAEGDDHGLTLPWEAKLPGYQVQHLPGEMVCLVRGDILSRESDLLEPGSYYTLLRVRIRGREFTILQADVNAAPRHSRAVALRRLAEVAHAHASERLLVLGDLNTPRDSFYFDPFRAELDSAIDRAGRGLSETWPAFFPMLTLDHLWCSRTLRPLSCRIGWPWLSDHRPVVAEFGER